MLKYFLIFMSLIIIFSSTAHSQIYYTGADTLQDNYSAVFGDLSYMYNSNSEYFDITIGPGMIYNKKQIEYRYPFLTVSGVKRNSTFYRFSFQAPVNWILIGLGHLADNLFYPNEKESYLTSKRLTRYFVFAPNSSLNIRVGDKKYLGLATHTDYLFVRTGGLDRGILFTPSIGFTAARDSRLTGRGGMTLSITYSMFWNFEGESQMDGIGLKINIYGDGTSH